MIAWVVVSRYVRARKRRRCMRRICQKMKRLEPQENSHAGPRPRFSFESEEGVWEPEYETDVPLVGVEMDLDDGSTTSLAATLS